MGASCTFTWVMFLALFGAVVTKAHRSGEGHAFRYGAEAGSDPNAPSSGPYSAGGGGGGGYIDDEAGDFHGVGADGGGSSYDADSAERNSFASNQAPPVSSADL